MIRQTKEMLQRLERVLDEEGIVRYRVCYGGKHPYLMLRVGDKTRTFTFSGTAGDRRSYENAASDLRKVIRGAR